MIGIIGAMEVEVEEIIEKMEQRTTETVFGQTFHCGTLHGVPCVTVQCGCGKVNAALCAQALICHYSPKVVINIGVAGGVGEQIQLGDIVLADGAVQHDMDTTAVGDEPGFISGINLVRIPTSKRLNEVLKQAAKACSYEGTVHTGPIATGDQFISNGETLHGIADRFGAFACEMETASIAQVCYVNQVEYTALRCISDHADNNAGVDFPKFAAYAAHRTTDILFEAMPHLGA